MGVLTILTWFAHFVATCAHIVNRFLSRNGPHLAAAIAFYAFFSLFPLALAIVSILGYVMQSVAVETWMARQMAQLAPISSDLIGDTIQQVVRARYVTGVLAIVGLLWASNAVFGAIRKGLNTVWGVSRPRPFLQERLLDGSLMVGGGLLLLVSISATATLSFLEVIARPFTEALLPGTMGQVIWSLATSGAPSALTFVTFATLYWVVPNTELRFREVLPGALAATAAFEVVKNVFVYYVRNYTDYHILYGPIGAVVALMAWFYISALIFLFVGAVTSYYVGWLHDRTARRRWRRVFTATDSWRARSAVARGDGSQGNGNNPGR